MYNYKMKFSHYLKRLQESEEFKKFKKENETSHLCAGFFILDFEGGKDTHQIDYYLPNGKIATFNLDDGVNLKLSEQTIENKTVPEIKQESETDIDILKSIVEDEMKNRTVTEKVKKIIAILHMNDNKLIWNLQCILDGLNLLSIHLDDSDKSILKFDKNSLLGIMKTLPKDKSLSKPQDSSQIKPETQDLQKPAESENKNL